MRRLLCLLTLLAVPSFNRADTPPAADRPEEKPFLVLDTGGHTAPVVKTLFTPDGTKLITVGEDSTIQIWNVETAEQLHVLRLPAAALHTAALSHDGRTLAVSGAPYRRGPRQSHPVFLVNLADHRIDKVLAEQEPVGSLAFSPDGKRLAVGTFAVEPKEPGTPGRPPVTSRVHFYDAGQGKKLDLELKGGKRRIHDLACASDGRSLVAVEPGETIRVWSLTSGAPPQVHKVAPRADPGCVAWAPDGKSLLVGGSDSPTTPQVLQLWSADGKLLKELDRGQVVTKPQPGGTFTIHSVSFLPNGHDVYCTWSHSSEDEESFGARGAFVLNLTTGQRQNRSWPSGYFTEPCGALSPDGKLGAVAGGGNGNAVNVWHFGDHPLVQSLVGKGRAAYRVGWGPDGRTVAWGMSARPKTTLSAEPPLNGAFSLTQLALRPRENFTAYRLDERERDGVSLQSTPRGVQIVRGDKTVRKVFPNPYHCGTLLPGDDRAVAPVGTVLSVWNTRTGDHVRPLRGPATAILAVAASADGRYVVSASANQTLTIHAPGQTEPLLSVFVAGPDWVAWTPEGYYAASPGGERLMGWQVNNGPDHLATFYPAAQFRARLYRPDVIGRVLDAGSVARALELADKDRGQKTAAVDLEHVLPPQVSLTVPTKGGGEVSEARVEVAAVARPAGNYTVDALQLLLDGRPYQGERSIKRAAPNTQGPVTQSWSVQLTPGPHRLRVLAHSPVSVGASADVEVTYRPAKAPGPADSAPTLHVLAVGINTYPGDLRLNWAVQDATELSQVLQQKAKPRPFGRVECRLLTDGQATRRGVLDGFDWLRKQMTGDDTAVIFYAGHGHKDGKDGQFYLIPQDVNPNDLAKTSVSGAEIRQKLLNVPGKVLVLLDACHSGAIGGSRPGGSLTSELRRALAADDCGVVVMCAAMAGEEAGESPEVKHGFFTKALVEGLAGKAPRNREGFTHLTGLHFYVEGQVSELSKDEQHVVIDRPATVASFPLTRP
jgi:WD40 repeat protein